MKGICRKVLAVDDPTSGARSSTNEVREKRAVGNEPASPDEVEWDCRGVHKADNSNSGVKDIAGFNDQSLESRSGRCGKTIQRPSKKRSFKARKKANALARLAGQRNIVCKTPLTEEAVIAVRSSRMVRGRGGRGMTKLETRRTNQ